MKIFSKISLIFIFTCKIFGANLQIINTELLKGERLIFSIEADGDNVEFPQIKELQGFKNLNNGIDGGFEVEYVVINGVKSKRKMKVSKDYIFLPTHSISIPSFEVIVDGKIEYTKPLHVKVVSMKELVSKVPYSAFLHVNNKSPHLNETVEITLKIKLDERNIPNFKNWNEKKLKKIFDVDFRNSKLDFVNKDGYFIEIIKYKVKPKKSGYLKIEPFAIELNFIKQNSFLSSLLAFFGLGIEKKIIFSNEVILHVKKQ